LSKVYRLIKKSAAYQTDLAEKQTKHKTVSQEQKKVDEKDSMPRTGAMGVRSDAITAAAQTSNSKMSREQKNALWKETMAAARK
jgi:phosphoribosylamine-glycine ligase